MTTFYDMLVLNLQRFPKNMKVNFTFGSKFLYSNPLENDKNNVGLNSWENQMKFKSKQQIEQYVDVTYLEKGTRLVFNLKDQMLEVIDSKDIMTVEELLNTLEGIKKMDLLHLHIDFNNYDSLIKLNKELKETFRIEGDNLNIHLYDILGTVELNTKLEDLKDNEYFFNLEVSNPNLLTIDFYVYSSF